MIIFKLLLLLLYYYFCYYYYYLFLLLLLLLLLLLSLLLLLFLVFRPSIYYEVRQVLSQSAIGITKCDRTDRHIAQLPKYSSVKLTLAS